MSNTNGHNIRRYVGEKLYLKEYANRKAAIVADKGKDTDVAPFWTEAFCTCMLVGCPDCGEEAKFWAEREAYTALRQEIARWQPEPPASFTGRRIHVEWEDEFGGRYWSSMDAGSLDREIWYRAQCGTMLSDIDEPMSMAA